MSKKRMQELHTLRRFARWDTQSQSADWLRREAGFGWSEGPVAELEMGYRVAASLIGGTR